MDILLSEQVGDLENVRENFKKIRKGFKDIPTATGAVWGGITGSISDQTDLISGGKILSSLLPALAITDTYVVSSEAEMLALGTVTVDNPIAAETGDIAVRTDETKTYILKGTDPSVLADWELLLTPTGGVVSVFGRFGAVTAQSGDYSFSLISGTAGPTQGGTGLTSYVKGDVLIATGTNTVGVVAASATDGYVFTWDLATGLPKWKAAAGGIPSMIGNGGKFLTTNGTVASWATVTASVDTTLDYTWTGKHVFANSFPTMFGRIFSAIGSANSTSVSAQFKKGISLFDDTYAVFLSNDPNNLLGVNKAGGYGRILLKLDSGGSLVFPDIINANGGVTSDGIIYAKGNLLINKASAGDQGILFWNQGNGNRHAIVHSNTDIIIKTSDAGGAPSSTVGFSHIVLKGDKASAFGVTQQTLIRSASNGLGGGINSVSAAAVLDLVNIPTLNYFGLKLTSLSTLERDVIYENAIPSGSYYTGSFTNGSANISTIQSVVIQAGDIISIRTSTLVGTEVSRAIIVSVNTAAKTAVMDRVFSGPTGTYYLPFNRTPSVPIGLVIFNSTLDAPQIRVSTGWKTFTLT